MPADFGPYHIVRRIASGGMAEVYLARQRGMEGVERTVVLKRVHPHYATDEEFVTMFLDEARLMAALSHPNIAQVFDLGRTGASYYLVMEHVRGPSLETLLLESQKRGARGLPLSLALPILLQVAESLAYLHELRDEFGRPLDVVHRDLNPTNVMIGYNGAAKLIDFGIAKAAIRVYETRQGVIKGTYGYIAPEQLRGAPIDHRADLFSLGVLMYEVCTGALPFGPGEAPNLLERILNAQYRKPSRVSPDFPIELEPLIDGCLAPDPSARLASLRELIVGLTGFMASRRIVASTTFVADAVRELVPDPESRPLVIKRVEGRNPYAGDRDADEQTATKAAAHWPSAPNRDDEHTQTVRSAPAFDGIEPRERGASPSAALPLPSTASLAGNAAPRSLAPDAGHRRALVLGVTFGAVLMAIVVLAYWLFARVAG